MLRENGHQPRLHQLAVADARFKFNRKVRQQIPVISWVIHNGKGTSHKRFEVKRAGPAGGNQGAEFEQLASA